LKSLCQEYYLAPESDRLYAATHDKCAITVDRGFYVQWCWNTQMYIIAKPLPSDIQKNVIFIGMSQHYSNCYFTGKCTCTCGSGMHMQLLVGTIIMSMATIHMAKSSAALWTLGICDVHMFFHVVAAMW